MRQKTKSTTGMSMARTDTTTEKVSINLLRNRMQRSGSLKIPRYSSVALPRLRSLATV